MPARSQPLPGALVAVAADLRDVTQAQPAVSGDREQGAPACPACEGRPRLAVFRRYELVTVEPLWHCEHCLGFWAAGDSLARGVADPGSGHAAVHAARAPARCRSCFGRLTPEGVCRKCGKTLPRYDCPACGAAMERRQEGGITLDACPTCRGTWFDTGEIALVYGLTPAPTAMTKVYGELEPVEESGLIMGALSIVARLFLPF